MTDISLNGSKEFVDTVAQLLRSVAAALLVEPGGPATPDAELAHLLGGLR